MTHLLIDGQVCVPQQAWLHPELRLRLPVLEGIARKLEAGDFEVPHLTELEQYEYDWLMSRVVGPTAYSLPFLCPEYCDKLVVEADAMAEAVGYEPNPDEDEAFQIPELVLEQVCPMLFASLSVLKQRVLDVYSVLLYGGRAHNIRSIQFARYEPQGTAHGNWHKDASSDVTAVVSLQPENFEGGGTDLRMNGRTYLSVPPLPKGYCLFFNGKHTLHRGRAVTAGRRDLLVFWTEYKEYDDD